MIIAFSGKSQAGKTTLANHLLNRYNFSILSFATPLKKKASEDFGIPLDSVFNKKSDEIELSGRRTTIRKLLIDLGGLYRTLDSDYWVKALERDMDMLEAYPGANIAIDDMRYLNEAKLLKARGAALIRIERPGIDLIDDPSEKQLDDYDFTLKILNNGTEEDLLKSMDALFPTSVLSGLDS